MITYYIIILSVTGKDDSTSTRPSAADSQQSNSSASSSVSSATASNFPLNTTSAAAVKSDKTNSKLQTDNKPVIRPPTKLELIKYEKTSSWCFGVSWREDGNILCSTSRHGVEVRSGTDLKLIKKINSTGSVWSAYSVGDQLITKVKKAGIVSTYIGTESNPQHTLLLQYESHYISHLPVSDSQLSVSDSIIADINAAIKQLRVYTITGNHLYNIDISYMSDPEGVHILPAGDSVLVSDWGDEGEVRKYKLQAGEHHQPVW